MTSPNKSFEIHFLGQEVKQVPSKEDALWHLGAKFGGRRFNEAVKSNLITFKDSYVIVRPGINDLNIKSEVA